MKPISGIDLEGELEQIRRIYVRALPRQRLHIIRQRLEDHHYGPNRLSTAVSAVEAFSRSLLLYAKASGERSLIPKLYEEFKDTSPEKMIVLFLRHRSCGTPRQVFGSREWILFTYAVRFRNLVVHECTYLGMDKFPSLIDACGAVLEKLVELAGLNHSGIRKMVNEAGLMGNTELTYGFDPEES